MSDWGDTPYDRGYVNGYKHGKSEAEDEAQAMVAAAYEAAAAMMDAAHTRHMIAIGRNPVDYASEHSMRSIDIRALTPDDAAAALARRDAKMKAEGMREAAGLLEGGYDRGVCQRYRADGLPSKNDLCQHGITQYDDCDQCAVAAVHNLADKTEQEGA